MRNVLGFFYFLLGLPFLIAFPATCNSLAALRAARGGANRPRSQSPTKLAPVLDPRALSPTPPSFHLSPTSGRPPEVGLGRSPAVLAGEKMLGKMGVFEAEC